MKKNILVFASGMLALASACNNSAEPVTTTVTDTVMQVVTDTVTKVVEVQAEIDTAAIVAFYTSEHAKVKGTLQKSSKPKGSKKVSVDSDPIFVSTDVMMPIPVAATQTTPTPTPAPTPKPEVKVVHDVRMYYFIPDEKASFPGGEKALDKYLVENLEYPEKAFDAGQSRTVYPTLFLDAQGNPKEVTFRYEPTIYGFQDEARRILMSSPRWNPAKVSGKPVASKFTIPISFKIQ